MRPSRVTLSLAMATAVTAVSSAAVVILLAAPLSSLTIAGGRVVVTGVGLAIIARGRLREALGGLHGALRWRAALAAALLAIHFGTWIASLQLTSVVRSMTLVATQPLFAGLLARTLGDRTSWPLYAGGGVAVVGTAVMVGWSPDGGVEPFGVGDGLALIAAAAAAGYLAVGRSVRDHVPLAGYLALVHLGAALLLGAALVVTSTPLARGVVETGDLVAVVYLGLVPGLVGHGLLNWCVRHLPVHTVSLAILLEPLGATALTMLVLGHPVSSREAIGAAILLLGVAVGLRARRG